jgi:hypothetical protein
MNASPLARTLAAALMLIGATGCGRAPESGDTRPWTAFVEDLIDIERFARLDTGTTALLCSYDREGGNADYNYFIAPGREPGWRVIADLKGPGVVRRFWTTGMKRGHRYRFYIDGETRPRVDAPVEALFGEQEPFTPPLARYLNFCWFSYVPITYQRSLRIEIQEPQRQESGDLQRLYYHLNVETLPPSSRVESFPARLSDEHRAALARVAARWNAAALPPVPPDDADQNARLIEPGETSTLWETEGEGVVEEAWLTVEPADPAAWNPVELAALQQDILVRAYYDQRPSPSLCLPLGDMFLSAWRARDLGTLALGRSGNRSRFALPMPYQKGIRFELVNQADKSVRAALLPRVRAGRHPAHGYLHAVWNRSGPEPGAPHPILRAQGRGKFVGLFLGVTNLKPDWWALEGDERFFVDAKRPPFWHGTGLEDYFNGGWYYRGSAITPLSGVPDHVPFRTSQYRFHIADPLHFTDSLYAEIERGDANVSPAWFQSVAWFYLDRPSDVPCAEKREQRTAVEHPQFRPLLMLQLDELERLNNFEAARALAREYVHRYPREPEAGVLRLRILEYDRYLGAEIGPEDYRPFLAGEHGPAAAEQARLLLWFYEKPTRALVGLNANGPCTLYLDGASVLSGDHPFQLFVAGVELADGPHTLAAEARVVRPDPWVKFGIRTHSGFAGSGLGTWAARARNDGWTSPAGALENAERIQGNNLPRGTPDAPYIGGVPDAFILLGSKAYAMRPRDWGYSYRGPIYCRLDFTTPLTGFPSWSRDVTGLPE